MIRIALSRRVKIADQSFLSIFSIKTLLFSIGKGDRKLKAKIQNIEKRFYILSIKNSSNREVDARKIRKDIQKSLFFLRPHRIYGQMLRQWPPFYLCRRM